MGQHIPDYILTQFLHSYEKGDVWQVHCGATWLTVWFYSNSQIERHKDLPIYKTMKEEYYKLVRQFLDLKLSRADNIDLYFESKENFETKYRSNWGFYYT